MTPADLKLCKRDKKNRPLVKDGPYIFFVDGHNEKHALLYYQSDDLWGAVEWKLLSPVPPDEPVPVPPPQFRHESDPPKKRIIQPGERFIYFAADFKDPVVHTNASVVETRNEHWPIVPAPPQWKQFALQIRELCDKMLSLPEPADSPHKP